jgi:hypothetical protein
MTTIIGADAAKLAGLQVDTLQKVRSGQITLEQWEWFNLLTKEARDALSGNGAAPAITKKPKPQQSQSILRLISGEETLVLDPTDGKETISEAGDVFTGYIDPDFKSWGADEPSGPTPETPVQVHEMVQDATFAQMFASLGVDKERLCVTQAQIKQFCQKHRTWLRTDGYATFFLFKSKGKFFVAHVHFDGGGRLKVHVHRFEHDNVWSGVRQHRVVVPQL